MVLGTCLAFPGNGIAAAKSPPDAPPPTRVARSYETAWEEALADARAGRVARAIHGLEELADRNADPLAELYRTVMLAQLRLAHGDTAGSDALLAGMLGASRPDSAAIAARDPARDPLVQPVWRRHLHMLRLRTSATRHPVVRKAYLLAALNAPLEPVERAEVLSQLAELDTSVVLPAERQDFIRRLVPLAVPDGRLRALRDRLAAEAAPDTSIATANLLLDLEDKLGLWSEAIARAERLLARAPEGERARDLRLRIAQWYVRRGSHAEAIRLYGEYRGRYGDTPEVLMQLARAHRALGDDAAARGWYDRVLALFPRDGRSAEILWMRAFDDEIAGRLAAARGAYARIARDFPQHVRSGEAMFRIGLVHYKAGDPASARAAFAELRKAGKSGRLTAAARYWEGRSRLAMGDTAGARADWAGLAAEFPFGHYGHSARAGLAGTGGVPDSLEWNAWLNRAEGDSVGRWLRADVPGNRILPDGFGESSWLSPDALFRLQLDTLAVLTMQARVAAAPDDLLPLYEAAVRCREAGFSFEAYRFARRLSDQLPLARWPSAPVDVLRLFYPPSYAELVRPEAERAGIDPALALALIKQESGFDPNAVSRVGARGLMQLMPATGAEQARKEGVGSFHPDSLFRPAMNVRLGVAYLADVLKSHGGEPSLALAHYNAGPIALARWMPRLQGRPLEEAVEDIGYAETREYVKRVGANWKTYRVLWAEVPSGGGNRDAAHGK